MFRSGAFFVRDRCPISHLFHDTSRKFVFRNHYLSSKLQFRYLSGTSGGGLDERLIDFAVLRRLAIDGDHANLKRKLQTVGKSHFSIQSNHVGQIIAKIAIVSVKENGNDLLPHFLLESLGTKGSPIYACGLIDMINIYLDNGYIDHALDSFKKFNITGLKLDLLTSKRLLSSLCTSFRMNEMIFVLNNIIISAEVICIIANPFIMSSNISIFDAYFKKYITQVPYSSLESSSTDDVISILSSIFWARFRRKLSNTELVDEELNILERIFERNIFEPIFELRSTTDVYEMTVKKIISFMSHPIYYDIRRLEECLPLSTFMTELHPQSFETLLENPPNHEVYQFPYVVEDRDTIPDLFPRFRIQDITSKVITLRNGQGPVLLYSEALFPWEQGFRGRFAEYYAELRESSVFVLGKNIISVSSTSNVSMDDGDGDDQDKEEGVTENTDYEDILNNNTDRVHDLSSLNKAIQHRFFRDQINSKDKDFLSCYADVMTAVIDIVNKTDLILENCPTQELYTLTHFLVIYESRTKIDVMNTEFIDKFFTVSADRVAEMSSDVLAGIMYSVSRVRVRSSHNGKIHAPPPGWIPLYLSSILLRMHEFQPSNLTMISNSLIRFKVLPTSDWLRAYLNRLSCLVSNHVEEEPKDDDDNKIKMTDFDQTFLFLKTFNVDTESLVPGWAAEFQAKGDELRLRATTPEIEK